VSAAGAVSGRADNADGNAICFEERERPVKARHIRSGKTDNFLPDRGRHSMVFQKSPHARLPFAVGLAARAYVTDKECLYLSTTTSQPRSGLEGRSMRIAFAESWNKLRKAASPPRLLEP
jgi:hypothetical protein